MTVQSVEAALSPFQHAYELRAREDQGSVIVEVKAHRWHLLCVMVPSEDITTLIDNSLDVLRGC